MTFLESQRTQESFFDEKMRNKSPSFRRNSEKVIKQFDEFCMQKYSKPSGEIIKEINLLVGEKKEIIIYEVIQKFVNHLQGYLRPNTLATYFSGFKPYFSYMTYTKLHSEDIRSSVEFPKHIEEEAYPMTVQQINEILQHSSHRRRAFYLTMASSGVRGQELCKCRKRDFVRKYDRLMIKLPATYTKTRKARRTFVSSEAEPLVSDLLRTLNEDDLVFTDNEDSEKAIANERMAFDYARDKTSFADLKYESGIHKITIHSFRSFFITTVEPVNEGLGHALSGHSKEQKRYERYSDEKLLEFYLKVEPSLMILDAVGGNKGVNDRIRQLEKQLEEHRKFILELKFGKDQRV